MTVVLDGKLTSKNLLDSLKAKIEANSPGWARAPKLSVVLVGENPASQVYVGRKVKIAKEIGMQSELITLDASESQEALEAVIDRLNADPTVDGILVQLPLPNQMDANRILERINPDKDVDGFHPMNMGRLLAGTNPVALPCTPAGIMVMLDAYKIELKGKHAVVIGRSNIVGKPMAQLLLQRDATVTMAHSRTQDLPSIARQADILVVAVGRAEMVEPSWVKPGAVVVDVGMNRNAEGKLVGDVAYGPVSGVAGAITPVPGGVGPMTIAMLMANTLALFESRL